MWLESDAGNTPARPHRPDRKSTRLNSSHVAISYAVFCLKKKKTNHMTSYPHTATHSAPLHAGNPPHDLRHTRPSPPISTPHPTTTQPHHPSHHLTPAPTP